MIHIKYKSNKGKSNAWYEVTNIDKSTVRVINEKEHSFFNNFIIKIDGKQYTTWSNKFQLHFEKTLMWEKLKQ